MIFSKAKVLLFTIAVIAIIVLTLSLYLTSPNVTALERGGPSEFGQFGDMIGGILNPIFSFLTVLLLVKTLQREEIVSEEDKNYAAEVREIDKIRREEDRAEVAKVRKDEMLKLLESTIKKSKDLFYTKLKTRKCFEVESSPEISELTFMEFYENNNPRDILTLVELVKFSNDVVKSNIDIGKDKLEQLQKAHEIKESHIIFIMDLRLDIEYIKQAYLQLIKNQKISLFRHFTFMEYDNFMNEMLNLKLICEEDHCALDTEYPEKMAGRSPYSIEEIDT